MKEVCDGFCGGLGLGGVIGPLIPLLRLGLAGGFDFGGVGLLFDKEIGDFEIVDFFGNDDGIDFFGGIEELLCFFVRDLGGGGGFAFGFLIIVFFIDFFVIGAGAGRVGVFFDNDDIFDFFFDANVLGFGGAFVIVFFGGTEFVFEDVVAFIVFVAYMFSYNSPNNDA